MELVMNLCFVLGLFTTVGLGCNKGLVDKNPSNSEQNLTFTIAHYKVPCVGEGVMLCYLVTEDGEQTYFYGDIEGFEYEWGYNYEIRVKESSVAEPMADGLSSEYRLVKLLSKKKAAPDARFELPATLDEFSLLSSEGDACRYYQTVSVDSGDFTCTQLQAAERIVFQHKKDGGIVAVELN